MTEIIEISIDIVNKKISFVYPDSTSEEVDLPDQAFIKVIGATPFRDIILWQADTKEPVLTKVAEKSSKVKRKKRKSQGKDA